MACRETIGQVNGNRPWHLQQNHSGAHDGDRDLSMPFDDDPLDHDLLPDRYGRQRWGTDQPCGRFQRRATTPLNRRTNLHREWRVLYVCRGHRGYRCDGRSVPATGHRPAQAVPAGWLHCHQLGAAGGVRPGLSQICEQWIKERKGAIKAPGCVPFLRCQRECVQLHAVVHNSAISCVRWQCPGAAEPWSLTSLREKADQDRPQGGEPRALRHWRTTLR